MGSLGKYLHLNLPTPQQVAKQEIEAIEAEDEEVMEQEAAEGGRPIMQLIIQLQEDGGLFVRVDCDETSPRNAEGAAKCLAMLFDGGFNDKVKELLVSHCKTFAEKLYYEDVLRRIDQHERLKDDPIVKPCHFSRWNGAGQ